MKRISLFLLVVSVVVISGQSASAYLVTEDYGGTNVTWDSITKYYWYWDLNRFLWMTYAEQLAEISSIHIPGYTGTWQMANQSQMQAIFAYGPAGEIVEGFAPTQFFVNQGGGSNYTANIQFYIDFTGRYEYDDPADALGKHPIYQFYIYADIESTPDSYYDEWYGDSNGYGSPYEGDDNSDDLWYTGAWVVSTDLAVVPVPPSLLLMASGLIGCVGLKRWFRR